ncbi:MAG: efflux RND transporter periplasmic adaptor subunit [Rubrivivax sp.]|jgi:multidrug efflux system membrane fusion protein
MAAFAWTAGSPGLVRAAEPAHATHLVAATLSSGVQRIEAVVEAERQAVLSVPVQGAVVELARRAGDPVRAGQLILRVDARAAAQGVQVAGAQAEAARATLKLAQRELARQQQLFQQGFISRAALDQAEAQAQATQAQAQAQLSAAGAAHTQAGLHELRAPFDGVLAELSVTLGDLAMPGRPLATVVDPGRLRVAVQVPLSRLEAALREPAQLRIELPSAGNRLIVPTRVERLPLVDAASHTVTLRLELPAASGAAPGQFARVLIPQAGESPSLRVPGSALIRRGELDAVFVLGPQGQPLLRQVRVGPTVGGEVEILAGVAVGDRVLTAPRRVGATR